MTTVDEITEAVRAWIDYHDSPTVRRRFPDAPVVIAEGEYADGTHVSARFTPNMFASQPQTPGFLYRLSRNKWSAQTCFTEEFLLDVGLTIVHKQTQRELDGHG